MEFCCLKLIYDLKAHGGLSSPKTNLMKYFDLKEKL